jgi:LPXTG-motif cell wall-anchored protein
MSKLFVPSRARPAVASIGIGTILVIVALLGLGTPAAFAHHAEVTASVDCNGLVSYTSTAWNGETEASRTNPNIGVWFSTNGGGSFTQLPHESHHQFNAANGFSFSDSFQLTSPLPATVIVRVQAQANWANGSAPGGARETSVMTLPECPATTTTTASTSTTSTSTPSSSTTSTTAATTTTAPASTSTTAAVQVAGVTASSAPTATAAAEPAQLPRTGGSTAPLAAVGVGFLALGAALVRRNRTVADTV